MRRIGVLFPEDEPGRGVELADYLASVEAQTRRGRTRRRRRMARGWALPPFPLAREWLAAVPDRRLSRAQAWAAIIGVPVAVLAIVATVVIAVVAA